MTANLKKIEGKVGLEIQRLQLPNLKSNSVSGLWVQNSVVDLRDVQTTLELMELLKPIAHSLKCSLVFKVLRVLYCRVLNQIYF